ncbi:hypothetical protein DRJ19_01555 [Candidatus Woesearchaeota archaeon]|nr:MAG: hypothetical protein DRJ19_01555 [Candidatus Woesearchaeota archaeon]
MQKMKNFFEKEEVRKLINKIKKELGSAFRPLFFFHDDCDGICSFLILYKILPQAEKPYVIVKSDPYVDKRFIGKLRYANPDKIVILDLADIKQSFLERSNQRIIWIDHHGPAEKKNDRILYLNPRLHGCNYPVSALCYEIAGKPESLLWIATIGCIADWHVPDFFPLFLKKYPDLAERKAIGDIIYKTKLGKIIRIFSFALMGRSKEAYPYIEHIKKLQSPYELLNAETSHARIILKKYEKINKEYQSLFAKVLKSIKKQKEKKLFLFTYSNAKYSLTKELANELIYLFPEKIIIIGREKNDEISLSLRARKLDLRKALAYSLKGLWGYGGGHECAAGATIKKSDLSLFLKRIKTFISQPQQ